MFDGLHIALFVCAAFVILGVFLEGHEHLEEYRAHGFRPLAPKIGFAMLVLGLAGEFWLGIRIGQKENRARLNAQLALGKLNLEAQRLRAANLELERVVQPRRLEPEQIDAIRCAVVPYAGQKFKIAVPAADLEAALLALQIREILIDAQWNDVVGVVERRPDLFNIAVDIAHGSDADEVTEVVVAALVQAGIVVFPPPQPQEPIAADVVEIRVGLKPLPGLLRHSDH